MTDTPSVIDVQAKEVTGADIRNPLTLLPTLGAPLADGKYGGTSTDQAGNIYAVVLLDLQPGKRLNWRAAMDFAAEHDAFLPSRVEALMLFMNLRSEFVPGWHWTDAQAGAHYAWLQIFGDGDQGSIGKDIEAVVRLVRRLPINPSILSGV